MARFVIANIKNPVIRRTTLLIMFVPLVLLSFVVETINEVVIPIIKDIPDVFRNTWKGR